MLPRVRTAIGPLLAGALLAALLAGCAVASPATRPADGPDTLVIGATTDPNTLLPWRATQFQAVTVLEQLYGTLTEFDARLDVVPGLATTWQTAPDGLALTLTLRQDVRFADGSVFDAADVVSSLDRIRDESTGAVARSSLAAVTAVTAPDPTTVVLALSGPDAGLPAALASTNLAMLSADDTEAEVASAPNGTGAFRLIERTPDQGLTLAANPDFWAGTPPLRVVEFRVVPDETSIVAALQSGHVQFAVFDDPLVADVARRSALAVADTPQLSYHVLQLNAAVAPLDRREVRLAVACAIDRQQVLDTAAYGAGQVTGPITAPAYRSDPDARPCPRRDVAAARAYLAAAGLANGVTLPVIVSQGEYASAVAEATNIAAQLAEVGITVELEVLESGAFVERWSAAAFPAAVALNGGRPDPDGMYGRYFTSTGSLSAVAGFRSPELDALFAAGRAESDPAARRATYRQISALLEREAPWVWLFTGSTYTVTTPGVSGFVPMPNGSLRGLRATTRPGSP